jgi:chromosome segregation ATPase
MRAVADKSAAALAAAEAELTKLKASLETAQKNLQSSKEAAAKLEAQKTAAAEIAKKEIASLQAQANDAIGTLSAAKAESAGIQAKRDKTEQFSDAYKEMTRQLEAAKKKVAEVRAPADRDQKEVTELQTTADKIAAALITAEAEAEKVKESLAKTDENYQHYQELTKQFDAANKKLAAAKEATNKAALDAAACRTAVAQLKVAQFHAGLFKAREALSARQRDHDKLVAALGAAQEDNAKAAHNLAAARKALDMATAKIEALEAALKAAWQSNDTASTEVRNAQSVVANLELAVRKTTNASPQLALEAGRKVLVEKQNAALATARQLDSARSDLAKAQTESAALLREIKHHGETVIAGDAKIAYARVIVDRSAQQLAVEKARVDRLTAEYDRLKSPPVEIVQQAKR